MQNTGDIYKKKTILNNMMLTTPKCYFPHTNSPLDLCKRICCSQAASQHAHCQTDSERFADNLPKLPLIESMPFLGNFCPFPHKAPTVVSGLLSHEAHYGGTQRTLMGPESLTPNWGRNCTDCALLSSTQNAYCMLSDNLFFFFSTASNVITFCDKSSYEKVNELLF